MIPLELLHRFPFFSFMKMKAVAKATMERLQMTRGQLAAEMVEPPKKLVS